MKKTFLYRRYAEANPDLAGAFGGEDEVALEDHFERFGWQENRGVPLADYLTLETVLCSEQGHLLLSGWADRRIVRDIAVTVEIGYVMYELGVIEPIWVDRMDVADVTGDTERPSGFVALLKLDDIRLHSHLNVLINGKKLFENKKVRWLSVDHFLNRALGACAVLSDRPAGRTLLAAEQLYAPFHELWTEFLGGLNFTRAFAHGPGGATDGPVDQSIIIALYRKADMLIPQLESLAEILRETNTEVIVVANQLQDAERVVRQVAGFCQLNDTRLELYICSGNSGFSAANNFGADVARGETLIFMNPDIFPPERNAGPALEFLTSDPGDALVGAMLYYGDGMLMHSGMYVASDIAFDPRSGRSEPILRVEHFGKGLTHHVDDAPEAIEGVMQAVRDRKLLATAALWKIRKSLFVEMGGLSTDYLFAYYEDADFCLRMLQGDHPVKIDETARWIHMEGVGKAHPPAVRSFMWLNRALFTRRFADSGLVDPAETDLFQL